jgi:hypothetical protein
MAAPPPSFGQRQYWNDRYAKTSKAYDWLNHADVLDGQLDQALKACSNPSPKILHIGCGNSELSFNLRFKVRDPSQIHNIDYSPVVIDWGKATEQDMFGVNAGENNSVTASTAKDFAMPMMEWDEVDLLTLQSIIAKCALGGYSIVLDKSTCDSLACTSTTELPMPYFLYTEGVDSTSFLDITKSYKGTVNAVQVLATHLALLSRPRAKWIAYSYSSTRFWFLDPDFEYKDEPHSPVALHPGLPDPKVLWTLISREQIVRPYGASGETTTADAGDTHFLYIIERTDVPLMVRTMNHDSQTASMSVSSGQQN